MVRRALPAVVLVALSGLLVAAVVDALQVRSDRNQAQATADRLQMALVQLRARLQTSDQIIGSLQREIDSGNQLVDGLRGQIEWDKSHLLDCWTAITLVFPAESIPTSVRTSVGAARSGRSIGHYIENCAIDAVP